MLISVKIEISWNPIDHLHHDLDHVHLLPPMEEHLLELVFVGKRTSRKIHRLLTLFHPVIVRIKENMTLFLPVK